MNRPPYPKNRLPEEKRAKVLVFGTRSFDDYALLQEKLDHYLSQLKDPIIIVGEEKYGVGQLAIKYATWNWLTYILFEADWDKHGRAAGPIRNTEMVDYIEKHNGFAIGFWDGDSPGTEDTIEKLRAKLPAKSIKIVHF